ncbi:MAG TPA: hypothetical protein VFX78_01145 [Candidatus Eisenbacteria bacterium]|nr:hypothetical protein [Candidatus Eisenbacteria bacterium]
MKRHAAVAAFAVVLASLVLTVPAFAGSLGAGVHYLKTVGDIKDNAAWDKNALGFIGSYQHAAGLLKLEGDVEWVNDYGGTDHSMIEPQAYALVGHHLYGGAGIGIGYIDDGWQDAPFYALRAGYVLGLSSLALDGFASYRFQKVDALQGVTSDDLDTVTFGLIARF